MFFDTESKYKVIITSKISVLGKYYKGFYNIIPLFIHFICNNIFKFLDIN